MGQNNDTTEHGDRQGQQGGVVKIPASERKRQAGYAPVAGSAASQGRLKTETAGYENDRPQGG
jgi:hypothetical protein